MFSARETLSASPSISRLLSTNWVWTLSPDSSNRMFSSRVPKRLSTPRLMRTLAFIDWVLGTSKQISRDKMEVFGWEWFESSPARLLRTPRDHLDLLYQGKATNP